MKRRFIFAGGNGVRNKARSPLPPLPVKLVCGLCFSVALLCVVRGADDFVDRVDEALTWASDNGQLRARVSGTLDLEGYAYSAPPPGLIIASGSTLFNPRLTLYLDAQLGDHVYVFAQGRLDRGFDPSSGGTMGRLDEYALRVTPWNDGRFNLQVGKFATVVGTWVRRHNSWDNPFVTAPLPYENLTGVWDVAAVRNGATLLRWAHVQPKTFPGDQFADTHFRLPVIWGPSYTTGASVSGELGAVTYAAEVKNGSLSSRPEYWDTSEVRWSHPTVSARLGWKLDEKWSAGFSASSGSYLLPEAAPTLAPGQGLGDYRERVLAQDVGYAWHHWQAWAEVYEARFEIPTVGDVATTAYYIEARYKFTPQLFGAMRWNQQLFGTVNDAGVARTWDYDTWRVDLAPTYRFTPYAQLKLQYSVQPGHVGDRAYEQLLAVQLTLRF